MSAFARVTGLPATEAAALQGDGVAGSPTSLVALTRYGLERQSRGDFQAAIEAFRAVADAAPKQALVWNNLALAHSGTGDHAQAIIALRKSLALEPTQTAAWISLASSALQLQDFVDAEAACGQAIALDDASGDAWLIRGMALAGRDDFAGAAQAFRRTLELTGENGALHANLGVVLFKSGRFHEAEQSFDSAVALGANVDDVAEMARLCRFVVAALDGDMVEVVVLARQAGLAPDIDALFKTALLCLDWAGHPSTAAKVAQSWVSVRPGCLEARHMADAAQGKPVKTTPAALVSHKFDSMADKFDEKLVGRLGYRGPEEIEALIGRWVTAKGNLNVLDAGCGTGLCASALRPYALRLTGVDLSEGMLAKARLGGLYDELQCADLVDTLRRPGAPWNLIVAADVFPYVGTLRDVFGAATSALKRGGWLAFSTEATEGEGFTLQTNGRYAHGRGYIASLAVSRFEIVEQTTVVLRREGGLAVEGDYFLMRRL